MELEKNRQTEIVEPYALPNGWTWARLGDFIDTYRGVSYKKTDVHSERLENDCLIMRGGNIDEGKINTETDNVYVDKSLVSQNQFVQKNDVIIVTSTGSTKVIGRAGISYQNYSDVAFGAFLTLARPNGKAEKAFVNQYFQSPLYRERIRQLASGVNINNIRLEYITESPFPLPPTLAEQQRIVNRIETMFAKLDEAKEKAQNVVDSFETRKAAILHKAFTGELTANWRKENGVADECWEEKRLEELSDKIGDGLHGTPIFDNEGKYAFVNGNNFFVDHIEIKTGTKFVGEAEYKKHFIQLSDNTVFVSINGTLGKTAFYNNEEIILGKSACFINVIPSILDKHFLRWLFESKYFIDYANEKATGSTIKNLGLKAMRNLKIKLPSLPEQQEIVRILDTVLEKESRAKEAAETVLEQIALLKKSILARAFRGEL